MAFLMAAYDEEEVKGETRVVLRLHHRIAPYKVAVLPLSKKPELSEPARALAAELRGSFMCDYDETQSIGRRYRRQDELGTPYCITMDFDSLEDHAVTVRERDSMEQERVAIAEVGAYLRERMV
jgi:glycyl-tRNA synthetase